MLFRCLIFCYLLLSVHPSTSLQSAYQIWDLEYNDDSCFSQDVTSWVISGPTVPSLANSYYNCAGKYLLGGINWSTTENQNSKYWTKTYTNLNAHSSIRYSIITYAIDGWDYTNPVGYAKGDYIEVVFDSTSVELYIVDPYNTIGGGGYTTNYCGNANSDLPNVPVFGSVDHSATTLTLKFVSHMSTYTSSESYGIREILLTFSTTTSPGLATPCADSGGVTIYNMPRCTCTKGKYNGAFGCADCDASCDSCFGGGSTQCYTCKDGYYFDGTACLACDSSCSRCTGPKNTQCIECASGYKLFDDICISTSRCTNAGFSLSTCTNQCLMACSSATRSTWAESCFPACEFPASEILDFTGLCLSCTGLSATLTTYDTAHASYDLTISPSGCDLDITVINWHLLVTEQTTPKVLPTFTFTTTKTGTAQYHVDITFTSQLSQAGQLTFAYNYLSATINVPLKAQDTSNAEEIKQATKTTKAVVAGVISGGLVGAIAAGATTVLWSIISFQQFVGYFLYINMKLPYHVEFFLSIVSASLWDYLPNPLDHLTNEIYVNLLDENGDIPERYQSPAKFEEYSVVPFFIKNGGTLIVTNLALLLILLFVLGLKRIKKLKKNKVLVFMKVALKWTVIGRTFLENGIPLSLAIFLQLRIMYFDNLYLAFCSSLGIISILSVVMMIVFFVRILSIRSNKHLEKPIVRRIYGTLYEGLILKSSAKYYHTLILLRGIVFVGVLVFLGSAPIIQIIYTIFCNIFLIYYMFTTAALEDFKLNIIARIKEILILGGEICLLLLYSKVDSERYYDIVGWIMVGLLTCAVALEVVYTVFNQIFNIKGTCNKVFRAFSFVMICFQKPKTEQTQQRVRRLKLRERQGELDQSDTTVIKMNETTMVANNNSSFDTSGYRK